MKQTDSVNLLYSKITESKGGVWKHVYNAPSCQQLSRKMDYSLIVSKEM